MGSIPRQAESEATAELAGGASFVSDADLKTALEKSDAGSDETEAALDAYADARIDGLRGAPVILALFTASALFIASRIPLSQHQAAAASP